MPAVLPGGGECAGLPIRQWQSLAGGVAWSPQEQIAADQQSSEDALVPTGAQNPAQISKLVSTLGKLDDRGRQAEMNESTPDQPRSFDAAQARGAEREGILEAAEGISHEVGVQPSSGAIRSFRVRHRGHGADEWSGRLGGRRTRSAWFTARRLHCLPMVRADGASAVTDKVEGTTLCRFGEFSTEEAIEARWRKLRFPDNASVPVDGKPRASESTEWMKHADGFVHLESGAPDQPAALSWRRTQRRREARS